jgi:hypothetical protein
MCFSRTGQFVHFHRVSLATLAISEGWTQVGAAVSFSNHAALESLSDTITNLIIALAATKDTGKIFPGLEQAAEMIFGISASMVQVAGETAALVDAVWHEFCALFLSD